MQKNRVLIVTVSGDLHADIVERKIARLGPPAYRLNLDEFPSGFDLDTQLAKGRWRGEIRRRDDGESLIIQNIGAVWIRKRGTMSYGDGLSVQETAFADDEMAHLLFGLLNSLDCYWMSRPAAIRNAQWKMEQMARAERMGFIVPRSVVSNRGAAVLGFSRDVGDVVFKPLSGSHLGASKVPDSARIAAGVMTARLSATDLKELDAIRSLPGFFRRMLTRPTNYV